MQVLIKIYLFIMIISTCSFSKTYKVSNININDTLSVKENIGTYYIKLNKSQNKIICNQMVNNFKATKSRVKMITKLTFSKGYKYISCPVVGERKGGWDLIGKAFRRPPSARPIKVIMDIFKYLQKNDTKLLHYIYTHKDYKGRSIYDYIDLSEKKFSQNPKDKYKKYYESIRYHVMSFDPFLEKNGNSNIIKETTFSLKSKE